MSPIPRDQSLDSTLAFLAQGYTFISRRCQRYQSDIFATRLMGRRVICMLGEEAAMVFYQPERFTRRGALPKTALWLLQDTGSVAMLDHDDHHWRKQMFMALMTPASIQQLADLTATEWQRCLREWSLLDQVVLFDKVEEILCRAVCAWTGIPLPEAQVEQRTHELSAMIKGAGHVGPQNWRGLWLRARTERWIRQIVEQIRHHELEVDEQCAAYVIAMHQDRKGALLDASIAAVELLNLLRPTVAVARYITFAALALHNYPACQPRLKAGNGEYREWFVQEVRRFYPFFPVVGGRVLQPFAWRGHHFAQGDWVLLDLYGTNHDPRIWQEPATFQPERFRQWNGSPFTLIPQGGGDYSVNHRCAGEWLTLVLMHQAVHLLTTAMRYTVPAQDLTVNPAKMPALPQSRFIIANVQQVG